MTKTQQKKLQKRTIVDGANMADETALSREPSNVTR